MEIQTKYLRLLTVDFENEEDQRCVIVDFIDYDYGCKSYFDILISLRKLYKYHFDIEVTADLTILDYDEGYNLDLMTMNDEEFSSLLSITPSYD